MISLQDKFPCREVWESFARRSHEAETVEAEARQKNMSLVEAEEKRIRANRRRSRRSNEGRKEGKEQQALLYRGTTHKQSGLMWTGKYQPRAGTDLIGNKPHVSKLRSVLSKFFLNIAFLVFDTSAPL